MADGDRLLGLGGDDVLQSAFNHTGLFGGSGDDELTTRFAIVASGAEAVEAVAEQSGGTGNDTLSAETEARGEGPLASGDATARNILDGGSGQDSITARAFVSRTGGIVRASNTIDGGSGNDVIDAVAEIDQQTAPERSFASNVIRGGSGDDEITALADGDFDGFVTESTNTIRGDAGADTIEARAIVESNGGGEAFNTLDGGSGDDILDASTFTHSNQSSTSGRNAVVGGTGDDTITADHDTDGENGSTTLENLLDGGVGDDTIAATMTALALVAALGRNLLEGGAGDDELTASIVADSGGGFLSVGPRRSTT